MTFHDFLRDLSKFFMTLSLHVAVTNENLIFKTFIVLT